MDSAALEEEEEEDLSRDEGGGCGRELFLSAVK
jgi:hypothetical protein